MGQIAQPEILGIAILLFSLVCLGTWPALLRLSSLQAHDEERLSLPPYSHGCCAFYRLEKLRNICHVYLDYSFVYFLISCLPLLLAMLVSGDRSALVFPLPSLGVAMLGGTLLSLGNLSLQRATIVLGGNLTLVLAIQASLTVLLGTSINYLLQPTMTSRPDLLIAGVAVFFIAIALASYAQLLYGRQHPQRSDYTEIEMPAPSKSTDSEDSNSVQVIERSTGLLNDTRRASVSLAIIVAVLGGLCFGFFSPCFNIAVNDPFGWVSAGLDPSSAMSVAIANLWFSLAFWLASIVGNTVLLRRQFPDSSVGGLLWAYLRQDALLDRQMAITAGLVCALGNVLQFHGGQLVGYATADLVQAYPLVSTVWDVLLFGEFQNLKCRSATLLMAMFLAYFAGVVLLAESSIHIL